MSEKIKAAGSGLNLSLSGLSQSIETKPPIISPFSFSIKLIVGPLLSHLLWKSFELYPSTDALYSISNFFLLLMPNKRLF